MSFDSSTFTSGYRPCAVCIDIRQTSQLWRLDMLFATFIRTYITGLEGFDGK